MNLSLLYFKQQLKLFFKSKILCVLYGIMFLSTIIGVGFLLIVPSEIFFTVSTISRFIFYESLLFMLISYLFLAKNQKSHLDEVISVAGHHQHYYLRHAILTLLFLLIVYNLFVFILLLANTIKTGEYSMFFTILGKEYLLNILFPQFATLSISIIISQIKNRTLSSVLLTAVIILLSPYMDILEWRTQPTMPIDQIVNIVHLPFSIFMQHSDWAVDELYGLQNELYKVFVIAFWLGLSILSIYLTVMRKNKTIYITGCLVVALIFASIYLPQSMLRLDTKWNGHHYDENHYHITDGKTIYNDEKVNYHIEEYKMNVRVARQLYVDGEFHLVSNQKSQDFVLTLYHQYTITNLKSDKDMTYNQEGDWLYLHFDEPIETVTLNMSYNGYHHILYSNYQAANLPGFFPWYPMSGQKEVVFQNGEILNINYGLNPYNKVEEATFEVQVDAQYPIVCNLDKKDKLYVGKSDSLTIIGGNIALYGKNQYNIINYFPYVISPYTTLESTLNWNEKEISSLKDSFQRIFGIKLKDFDNKKIIIMPKSIAQTQLMGGYAEFDDYILMAYNNSLRNTYQYYHLFNRFDIDSILLGEIISSDFVNSNTKEEYFQELIDTIDYSITNFQMYPSTDTEKLIEEYTNLKNHFIKKREDVGLDETLKEIGQLILGDDYEY